MRRGGLGLVTLLAALTAAGAARAQAPSGPCRLIFENTDTTRFTSVKLPSGAYNTYIGAGVIAHCPVQNLTLISDSGEYYGDQHIMYMINHVHYIEPRADVHADRGTYYEIDARLIADGNVDAKLPSGTTMLGPHADYLRALPGVRTQAQLTATGRPHMNLVQRDSNGTPSEPVGVDANTIVSLNDSLVFASGKVDIDRSDVDAHGDSAYMDQGIEFMRLMYQPSIHGKRHRPFTLRGLVIDLYSRQHELKRVKAYPEADAVSQELHLVSDTIDLRMIDGKLERAYAWGPKRAHAITTDRDDLADSIDAMLPGQVLRQVRSIRKAYAQSIPDTARLKNAKEKDWMRGDTIIAYFDSTKVDSTPPHPAAHAGSTPGDSTEDEPQPDVKTVVGIVEAQAFYQMPPKDKCADRPALNYTRGHKITINLENKEVHTVFVVDSSQGVYLEPIMDDTLAPADSVVGRNGKKTAKPRPKPKHEKTKSCVDSVAKADSAAKADSVAKGLLPAVKGDSTAVTPSTPTAPPTPPPGEPNEADSVPAVPLPRQKPMVQKP
jgi:hypothetical protein